MSRSYFYLLMATILFSPVCLAAIKVHDKTTKHFDLDKDGFLNRYEGELLKTHKFFDYPLVKNKRHKLYDFNSDGMLEPFEEKVYERDKKEGDLKKRPIFR